MDLFHDGVPVGIVRQGALGAKKSLSRLPAGRRQRSFRICESPRPDLRQDSSSSSSAMVRPWTVPWRTLVMSWNLLPVSVPGGWSSGPGCWIGAKLVQKARIRGPCRIPYRISRIVRHLAPSASPSESKGTERILDELARSGHTVAPSTAPVAIPGEMTGCLGLDRLPVGGPTPAGPSDEPHLKRPPGRRPGWRSASRPDGLTPGPARLPVGGRGGPTGRAVTRSGASSTMAVVLRIRPRVGSVRHGP